MTPLRLTLPEPPSANRYWRHARGRTYLAPDAVAYREAVADLVSAGDPIEGDVQVELVWHRSAKRGDIDNRAKQALDALSHAGVWRDDKQVWRLSIERHESPRAGRLEVTITARERQEAA